MSTFTVKQIAEILKTNEDTVRRWIGNNKLAATKTSKKAGYVITAEALNSFIKATPKYAPLVAASLSSSSVALPIVVGGLVGILSEIAKPTLTEEELQRYIEKKIGAQLESINKKTAALKKLQKEIEQEKRTLEKYQYAIENLDLKQIVDEYNNRE